MTLERGWGLAAMLVGALLLVAVFGPLKDVNTVVGLWVFSIIGAVGAIVAGLLLVVTGGPEKS